jgi:hypothetical protein
MVTAALADSGWTRPACSDQSRRPRHCPRLTPCVPRTSLAVT